MTDTLVSPRPLTRIIDSEGDVAKVSGDGELFVKSEDGLIATLETHSLLTEMRDLLVDIKAHLEILSGAEL